MGDYWHPLETPGALDRHVDVSPQPLMRPWGMRMVAILASWYACQWCKPTKQCVPLAKAHGDNQHTDAGRQPLARLIRILQTIGNVLELQHRARLSWAFARCQ